MVWALSGFPGGTGQMVGLGTAAYAVTLPSPSSAVAGPDGRGGTCLSVPARRARVTAQSIDNRPTVMLMVGRFCL